MLKADNHEMPLIRCPNCSSADTVKCGVIRGVQEYKCKNCGAVHSPSRPYRGRFKVYPESLKNRVATLYSKGFSTRQIQEKIKPKYNIRKEVINRWLRKRGLPARSRKTLPNTICPLCHEKGQSVRDGYTLNRLGVKQEQRFLCRHCGGFFTQTKIIGLKKYPDWFVKEAVAYYMKHRSATLKETSDYLYKTFGKAPEPSTIHDWLPATGIKPRGHD